MNGLIYCEHRNVSRLKLNIVLIRYERQTDFNYQAAKMFGSRWVNRDTVWLDWYPRLNGSMRPVSAYISNVIRLSPCSSASEYEMKSFAILRSEHSPLFMIRVAFYSHFPTCLCFQFLEVKPVAIQLNSIFICPTSQTEWNRHRPTNFRQYQFPYITSIDLKRS